MKSEGRRHAVNSSAPLTTWPEIQAKMAELGVTRPSALPYPWNVRAPAAWERWHADDPNGRADEDERRASAIADLQAIAARIGRTPGQHDLDRARSLGETEHSRNTIRKLFGSMTAAQAAAGLPPNVRGRAGKRNRDARDARDALAGLSQPVPDFPDGDPAAPAPRAQIEPRDITRAARRIA